MAKATNYKIVDAAGNSVSELRGMTKARAERIIRRCAKPGPGQRTDLKVVPA